MTRPDEQQSALLPPLKWNAWGDPAQAKTLSEGIRSLIKQALGVDDRARLLRAGGKSTLDLLRRKDSGVQDAPDVVLLPGSEEEIAAILSYSADHSIAIVPFGGG